MHHRTDKYDDFFIEYWVFHKPQQPILLLSINQLNKYYPWLRLNYTYHVHWSYCIFTHIIRFRKFLLHLNFHSLWKSQYIECPIIILGIGSLYRNESYAIYLTKWILFVFCNRKNSMADMYRSTIKTEESIIRVCI